MTAEERVALRVYSNGLLYFGAGIFSSFLVSLYFTPGGLEAINWAWFIGLSVALVVSVCVAYVLAQRAER